MKKGVVFYQTETARLQMLLTPTICNIITFYVEYDVTCALIKNIPACVQVPHPGGHSLGLQSVSGRSLMPFLRLLKRKEMSVKSYSSNGFFI
jgi:hypothetical protein